jgi:hypothetical protein
MEKVFRRTTPADAIAEEVRYWRGVTPSPGDNNLDGVGAQWRGAFARVAGFS